MRSLMLQKTRELSYFDFRVLTLQRTLWETFWTDFPRLFGSNFQGQRTTNKRTLPAGGWRCHLWSRPFRPPARPQLLRQLRPASPAAATAARQLLLGGFAAPGPTPVLPLLPFPYSPCVWNQVPSFAVSFTLRDSLQAEEKASLLSALMPTQNCSESPHQTQKAIICSDVAEEEAPCEQSPAGRPAIPGLCWVSSPRTDGHDDLVFSSRSGRVTGREEGSPQPGTTAKPGFVPSRRVRPTLHPPHSPANVRHGTKPGARWSPSPL